MPTVQPTVHPSAQVDPAAELADDVVVGPGCIIGPHVRIGAGTRLVASVFLEGPLTLGERNIVYPGACLGYAGQDLKYDPREPGAGLIIGHDNVIREHATIHRATRDEPTVIGDHNYFMINSHVGHDCRVGSRIILANGALLSGHVEVHDGAVLSGNTSVHQFCRVGRMSMISGNTAINADLPPFCIVSSRKRVGGLNLVGLRRAGLRDHIAPLREAFRILYRQGHARQIALAKIEQAVGRDPLVQEFVAFVRSAKRGITAYGYWRGADVEENNE